MQVIVIETMPFQQLNSARARDLDDSGQARWLRSGRD
jgi:hypothetical protein